MFPPFSVSEASRPLPPKRDIESFPNRRVPLSYFGLPQYMLDYYAKKGVHELYEWQGRCLLMEGVLEGRNLSYTAPTSGGKSLVAEILMCRRVFHNPRRNRALVVLPYVSLVVEKYEQLHGILRGRAIQGERLKVGCYYGSRVGVGEISHSESGNHRREHVVVCTIEKANNIVNHLIKTNAITKYRTVVVDEVHMMSDPKRGYLLEILINKLLYLQCTRNIDLQLITISATLPNIDDFVLYTNSVKFVATERPNHLTEYIIVSLRFSCEIESQQTL